MHWKVDLSPLNGAFFGAPNGEGSLVQVVVVTVAKIKVLSIARMIYPWRRSTCLDYRGTSTHSEGDGRRFDHILWTLQVLARRVGAPRGQRTLRWRRVIALFRRALVAARRVHAVKNQPRRGWRYPIRFGHLRASLKTIRARKRRQRRLRDSAWRRAALAQRSAADLVASIPPALALRERALAHTVLPLVRQLSAALSRTMPIDPAMWLKSSPEGWYLYRLAACDPTI